MPQDIKRYRSFAATRVEQLSNEDISLRRWLLLVRLGRWPLQFISIVFRWTCTRSRRGWLMRRKNSMHLIKECKTVTFISDGNRTWDPERGIELFRVRGGREFHKFKLESPAGYLFFEAEMSAYKIPAKL